MFGETQYRTFFRQVTGLNAFDYQVRVAALLMGKNKNVILHAPTGAGKTWAVIVPFLSKLWQHRPSRLIYALPLRTLAQGVYEQAKSVVPFLNGGCATLQTGEQPDDPFFSRGRIIVTTYDQVLSGLLENPYGLSRGLHNINAAAVAGALVVFDEFHLMHPDKAFLTAVAGMYLFRDLCQSVWMTATATASLRTVLRDALATEQVPGDVTEWKMLVQSLPSVTGVHRDIVMEDRHLTVDTVLAQHQKRSIVLFNQVLRAQRFHKELRREVEARRLTAEIILLHSRFFKDDRHAKEERLRKLFGKASDANAILVATQVIEAGIDVSCENLHTELCPINSLIQRSGRCARFEGEHGTVHVYPLPEEDRAWLPYGKERPDDTLTATESLLMDVQHAALEPIIADRWVQKIHQAEDEKALRQGWHSRLNECLRCVATVAVQRQEYGITHLIRGDNEDQLRLIISSEVNLPATPGQREGLSVRRKSLFRLLGSSVQPIGWFWDYSDAKPTWKPLKSTADIIGTYVVCLKPEFAAYSDDIGLIVGESGALESPPRQEPRRPGVPALRRELWTCHAQKVAREAQRRLEEDEFICEGFLGWGFERRYGLNAAAISRAARACALLHDLGKLQTQWQSWAESYERAKNPGYKHVAPLAHTDFDSNNQHDWEVQRGLGLRRPPHSAASAYFGSAFLAGLIGHVRTREQVASACAAAILGHHGGWWSEPSQLLPAANTLVSELVDFNVTPQQWVTVTACLDKKGRADSLLKLTTSANGLADWWPLVAYLTRILRLSDQRATSEAALNE